jgi:hypothetical protein
VTVPPTAERIVGVHTNLHRGICSRSGLLVAVTGLPKGSSFPAGGFSCWTFSLCDRIVIAKNILGQITKSPDSRKVVRWIEHLSLQGSSCAAADPGGIWSLVYVLGPHEDSSG